MSFLPAIVTLGLIIFMTSSLDRPCQATKYSIPVAYSSSVRCSFSAAARGQGKISCAVLCQTKLGHLCHIFAVSAGQCVICSQCDNQRATELNLGPVGPWPFAKMYLAGMFY